MPSTIQNPLGAIQTTVRVRVRNPDTAAIRQPLKRPPSACHHFSHDRRFQNNRRAESADDQPLPNPHPVPQRRAGPLPPLVIDHWSLVISALHSLIRHSSFGPTFRLRPRHSDSTLGFREPLGHQSLIGHRSIDRPPPSFVIRASSFGFHPWPLGLREPLALVIGHRSSVTGDPQSVIRHSSFVIRICTVDLQPSRVSRALLTCPWSIDLRPPSFSIRHSAFGFWPSGFSRAAHKKGADRSRRLLRISISV